MIEIVEGQEAADTNLEGRYVVGGLPLGIGRGAVFPGVPLYVEKSTAAGHHCRKIRLPGIENGRATDAVLVPMEWRDHSVRVRSDFVRFVCDHPEEVVALVNTRAAISGIMERRDHVPDAVLCGEIESVLSGAMDEDGPELQPALR